MEIKDLSVGSVGEPVREHHERLRLYGFVVPESETARAFFGPGTRDTLGDFQRAKGIKDSCEVCDKTAVLLAGQPAVSSSTSDRLPTISGGDLLRHNELGGDATAHIGSPVSTVGGSKLRPVASSRPVILDEATLRTPALMHLAGDGRAREFIKVRLTETLHRFVGQYLQFAPLSLRDALAEKLEVIDVSAATALTLRELGHKLLLGRRDSDPQIQKESDAFLRALPDDVRIGELLHLDQPIDRNPFLTDMVRRSRRYDLLRLTSIRDDEAIMSLLDAIDETPAALDKVLREWGEKRGVDMTSNVKSWLPMFLHFLCPLVLRHRKRRSQ